MNRGWYTVSAFEDSGSHLKIKHRANDEEKSVFAIKIFAKWMIFEPLLLLAMMASSHKTKLDKALVGDVSSGLLPVSGALADSIGLWDGSW